MIAFFLTSTIFFSSNTIQTNTHKQGIIKMGCKKLSIQEQFFFLRTSQTIPKAISRTGEKSFAPSYDDDGNCTSAVLNNSQWTLVFNAENRLIEMTLNTQNSVHLRLHGAKNDSCPKPMKLRTQHT